MSESRIPEKWIIALFAKFQARYLQKWSGAIAGIEEIAIQEWGDVLDGFTGEQIKYGLHHIPADWPPTAMEFRDLCKLQKKTAAQQDFAPALPMPKVEKEYVEAQLEEMRQIVNKRNNKL